MKKLVLLGLVLVSTATGCGHGWLPFRGATCRGGNCVGSAPAYTGCNDCATGAGYESYEGEQVVDGGYNMGAPMPGNVPYYPSNVTPPQPNTVPMGGAGR